MGTKLSQPDEDLYHRVDEVLHYIWDPIGVASMPEARDEYHGYLSVVFEQLKAGANSEEIAGYLSEVTTTRMGLPGDQKHDLEVARILLNWKVLITKKPS